MRFIYLSVALLLIAVSIGCASVRNVFYHEPHNISIWDARKIHPFGDLSGEYKQLNAQQSQLINQLYGQDISHEGDLIAYYKARKRKGIYGEQGNIFLMQAKGELGPLDILVCTTGGHVDEILIKNNPVLDGKSVIPDEFTQQFIGRSLQNSWKIAQDPTDLMALPSRIRPISDYPRTSQELANAIRKVLILAKVLEIQ
jgi:hypothetical protein